MSSERSPVRLSGFGRSANTAAIVLDLTLRPRGSQATRTIQSLDHHILLHRGTHISQLSVREVLGFRERVVRTGFRVARTLRVVASSRV